jgi:hypothetical protein
MDQEVHEIISLVRATYGTLNSHDIATLRTDNARWDASKTFTNNCTRMLANYAKLGAAYNIDGHQRYVELETASRSANDPAINACMLDYTKAFSSPGEQTFASCRAFFVQKLHIFTPSAGALVNSAAALPAPAAAAAAHTEPSLAAQMAALTAQVALLASTALGGNTNHNHAGGRTNGRGGRNTGRSSNRGGGGRGRGRGGSAGHLFCFRHGSNCAHAGPGCWEMTNAPPGQYTQAQINATAPGVYDGIQSAI